MKLLDLMLVKQDFFAGRDGGDLKCLIFNV